MAISRTIPRKAPTQKPNDFYACKQQGGAHGSPQGIPLELPSAPMEEKILGRPNLNKQTGRKI